MKEFQSITIKTEIEKEFTPLPDDTLTNVILVGNTVELISMKKVPSMAGLQNVKRVKNSNSIIYLDTGEIRERKRNEKRIDGSYINKSVKKLKRLINHNFGNNHGQFLTLTYDGVMTDEVRAKKDLNVFLAKLNYRYKVAYIWIIEPKETGSWHFHILVKAVEGIPDFKITCAELQKLWKHGSVDIEDVYDIKGLSCYLATAYTESNNTDFDNVDILSKSKSKSKQGRLHFYKSGMRIFGCSRNIKRPQQIKTTRGEAEEYIQGKRKTAEYSITIRDTDTNVVLNKINHEHFSC